MPVKTKQQTSGTFPFGEANGLSDGDTMDEVKGTIKALYPVKQAGRSTVQNGELNVDGNVIKFALWGDEIPKSLKGKVINILSTGKKFGEITYKIKSYSSEKKGEVTEEVIEIGNKCVIEEADDSGASVKSAPSESRVEYDRTGFSFIESVESIVTQHVTVHDMVHLAYAKKGLTPETLQAYVASAWIALDRAGKIVIGQNLADTPQLRKDARVLSSGNNEGGGTGSPESTHYNPQNWAETIIPSGPNKGKKLAEIGNDIHKLEKYRAEKGYTTGFWACVKQAAVDLSWNAPGEDDDIPF